MNITSDAFEHYDWLTVVDVVLMLFFLESNF